MVIASTAEQASLVEAALTKGELAELGITNLGLVINGIFKASSNDPLALAWEAENSKWLQELPNAFENLKPITLPLLPFATLGIDKLRVLLSAERRAEISPPCKVDTDIGQSQPPILDVLLEKLSRLSRAVIMTMGKGGVGKTWVTTEIAEALCRAGNRVHLATTDPANHLDYSLVERHAHLQSVALIRGKKQRTTGRRY